MAQQSQPSLRREQLAAAPRTRQGPPGQKPRSPSAPGPSPAVTSRDRGAAAKPGGPKPDGAAPDNSRRESGKIAAAKPGSPVVDAAKPDPKADTKPDGAKPDAVKADPAKA